MPTHGSLTKAGKVRNQTPKIASQNKKSAPPRTRNNNNFKKRILHPAPETRGGPRRGGRPRGRR
ncbi:30S ribosomal protein S30e [Candidatus Bathyarchaeota archaeon]|nr:30S ribosomal protein S30e [Candidatus Bathyarchaeota archaeon]